MRLDGDDEASLARRMGTTWDVLDRVLPAAKPSRFYLAIASRQAGGELHEATTATRAILVDPHSSKGIKRVADAIKATVTKAEQYRNTGMRHEC